MIQKIFRSGKNFATKQDVFHSLIVSQWDRLQPFGLSPPARQGEKRQAQPAAEEVWFLSFRGACSAEESLFLLDLDRGEIPRFARNDKQFEFFRSLSSLSYLELPAEGQPKQPGIERDDGGGHRPAKNGR